MSREARVYITLPGLEPEFNDILSISFLDRRPESLGSEGGPWILLFGLTEEKNNSRVVLAAHTHIWEGTQYRFLLPSLPRKTAQVIGSRPPYGEIAEE